jgi:hypothetical protein
MNYKEYKVFMLKDLPEFIQNWFIEYATEYRKNTALFYEIGHKIEFVEYQGEILKEGVIFEIQKWFIEQKCWKETVLIYFN